MASLHSRREMARRDPVVRASDITIWDTIHDPEVAIAIWERPVPEGLNDTEVIPSPGNIDMMFTLDGLVDRLREAMTEAGYAADIAKAAILADSAILAGHFARVMAIDRLRIRLEWVTGNACKKFHADYITARAICTYTGQGTQWSHTDAVPQPSETAPVEQLETGHVGLFKGRLWYPDILVLHRSPPIAGTGERRLLLVIDPAPADGDAHNGGTSPKQG